MKGLKSEIEQLIGDLNGTTDRNLQLIEDRIAQLNKVVHDADRHIDDARTQLTHILENLEKKRAALALDTASNPEGLRYAAHKEGEQPNPRSPLHSETYLPASRNPFSDLSNGAAATPVPPAAPAQPELLPESSPQIPSAAASGAAPAPPQLSESDVQSKLIALYRDGHSIAQIASELGITGGEVELILSLEYKLDK